MKPLRQSTITIIQFGPILGTDFLTVNTAVALASSHAELFKAGATTAVDISGRTWTHISGGVYQLTLTASDLDTVGPLLIHVHLASCTPRIVECQVMSALAYDTLYGGGYMPSDLKAIYASVNAASQLANGANSTSTVTVGNGATTTIIPTNLSTAVGGFYNGRTLVFLTGALTLQAASILGYNGVTKQLTTSALTSAPAAGDTALIV